MRRTAIAILTLSTLGAATATVLLTIALPASADPGPLPTQSPNITVEIPGSSASPSPSPTSSHGHRGPSPSPSPSSVEPVAPPIPSVPTSGASGLLVKPHKVHYEDVLLASGTGYAPRELVQIVAFPERVVVGDFSADSHGVLVARITISTKLGTGDHTLEATGWKSLHTLNGPFTVVAGTPAAASVFPWIAWAIAAGGIALAVIAFLIASALGVVPLGRRSPA